MILATCLPIYPADDMVFWPLENLGCFLVKSAYRTLSIAHQFHLPNSNFP